MRALVTKHHDHGGRPPTPAQDAVERRAQDEMNIADGVRSEWHADVLLLRLGVPLLVDLIEEPGADLPRFGERAG